jgi:hypothetical protein
MNSSEITIINDGQVKYPVSTKAMTAWVAANGPITSANYDQFCHEVECLGEKDHGTPGNRRMIEYCDKLREEGADYITLG